EIAQSYTERVPNFKLTSRGAHCIIAELPTKNLRIFPRSLIGFPKSSGLDTALMKICPTCQQKYADSLQFCLSDGTVLSVFEDPQATLRIDARQTQPPNQMKRGVTLGVVTVVGIGLIGLIFIVGVLALYRTLSHQ